RRDRVDVAGLRQRRQADLQHAGALEELVEDEPCPLRARLLDERVERLDPLLRLVGIDVGQLALELIEDLVHALVLRHVRTQVYGARAYGLRSACTSQRTSRSKVSERGHATLSVCPTSRAGPAGGSRGCGSRKSAYGGSSAGGASIPNGLV